MMAKEGSTKIVNFMTPGAGVLVLGRGHISHIVKMRYYTPSEQSSGVYREISLFVWLSVCPYVCLSISDLFGLTLAYRIWHMGASQ